MAIQIRQIRRPPVQREYLAGEIRKQIVEGRLAPGSKLPARAELLRRYGTAPGTIQSAFDQLDAQGFIERRPRQGVFVAPRPPHLYRYGMVFAERPLKGLSLSYYFQALMDEAKADRSRKIDFFYLSDPSHDRDRQAYQDLLETVLNDRIAGLVFTFSPYMLRPTPVVQKPGLPRVGIMGAFDPLLPDLRPAYVDYTAWINRALDTVQQRGCKRVALLATPGFIDHVRGFEQRVRSRGKTTRELWIQGVTHGMREWIGRVARLMMDGPRDTRPDALLIADDNLVEHATAGLAKTGLRVPEDLYVIAHCNFPNLPPAAVPVQWVGFDVRAVLHACWKLIDLQRQGRPLPTTVQLIPPIFENEFKPNAAPRVAARKQLEAAVD
jgi:DNA-binding LacI/PurR family transcriptional regulator/DNA-binding transcriptional regulator YhcF (GntR family)